MCWAKRKVEGYEGKTRTEAGIDKAYFASLSSLMLESQQTTAVGVEEGRVVPWI